MGDGDSSVRGRLLTAIGHVVLNALLENDELREIPSWYESVEGFGRHLEV